MSATSIIDDPSPLNYVVTHVFLPVRLPHHDDYTRENNLSLVHAVWAAAHAYSTHVCGIAEPQWLCVTKMLDNLQASIQSGHIIFQLRGMRTGGTLDTGHVISQLRGMQIGGTSTHGLSVDPC